MKGKDCNNIVDIHYQQTGEATVTNELGMREMQAKAYEARNRRFLLIKAPPASGKSRALMFIALDKLAHQGIKKVVPLGVVDAIIGRIVDGSIVNYVYNPRLQCLEKVES